MVTGPTSAATKEYWFGTAGTYDFAAQGYPTSRIYVVSSVGGGYTARGVFSNVVTMTGTIASLAIGDTVTINGTQWAAIATAPQFFADTGA